MDQTLLRSWWLLALRGAVAIVFGMFAIVWPAITLAALAIMFSAFALVAGVLWVFGAVRHRQADRHWWLMLLMGGFSMVAGVLAALHPALTTLALVLLMGVNALVGGVLDIVVAVRMRRSMAGGLLLGLTGVVSIMFGAIVLLFPLGAGALALAWMVGLYALLSGAMLLVLALQVRGWSRRRAGHGPPPAPRAV